MTEKNLASLVSQLTTEFAEKEYRDAYVEGNIAEGVAQQIRINREARNWTQQEFAGRLGDKKQSHVSRLEDPNYGRYSIRTLLDVAKTFDCALEVRFRGFSKFLENHRDLSPTALTASPYDQDVEESKRALAQSTYIDINSIADIGVSTFRSRWLDSTIPRTHRTPITPAIRVQEDKAVIFVVKIEPTQGQAVSSFETDPQHNRQQGIPQWALT